MSSDLRAAIARMVVEVPVIPARTLLALACEAHNATVTYGEHVSEHESPEVLARIQVTYLREQQVETDRALEEAVVRSSDPEAQLAFQSEILAAIADVYPDFAEACAELDLAIET